MTYAIAFGLALVGVCGACETGVKPRTGSAERDAVIGTGEAKPGGATGSAPRAPDGFAATVNERCPVMPRHVLGAYTAVEHTAVFEGQTVGFCCDDCPETWKVMSDAERLAALGRVVRVR
ncbi:MAG: hypothetical protein K2Q09_05685 [Phycisphaerales bacterium]|nr:hypothetical protein [Phycisphaerales bacterium]